MKDIVIEDRSPRKISGNNALLNEARDLYFADIYITEICETLNVTQDEMAIYVFGLDGRGTDPQCWYYQKKLRPAASAVTYERVKPLIVKKTEAKLMRVIDKTLDDWGDSYVFEDAKQLNSAVKSVEILDRITRLEEGKATSHAAVEVKTYSLRDLNEMKRQRDKENRNESSEAIECTDYEEVGDRKGNRPKE